LWIYYGMWVMKICTIPGCGVKHYGRGAV